ncbi:MAG: azurin [Parahaliea sp.]
MRIIRILFAASLVVLAAGTTAAENCSITVDSTDTMQFDTKDIAIPGACEEFTVNLTHSGQLPKNVMGHNWVLSKSADAQGIVSAGVAAGLDNNYLRPGDERVIAYTAVIGGGEETSVTFPVSQLSSGEKYTFFCSFPGHIAMMIGSVTVN